MTKWRNRLFSLFIPLSPKCNTKKIRYHQISNQTIHSMKTSFENKRFISLITFQPNKYFNLSFQIKSHAAIIILKSQYQLNKSPTTIIIISLL